MRANWRVKHGSSSTPEYFIWDKMKQRCLNPNNNRFRYYGARGITVCPRWLDSFENFLADIGPRPSLAHSIDRVDNDGPYSPENCRWATVDEQVNNMTSNVRLTLGDTTMTIAQWARVTGFRYQTIWSRLRAGWSAEKTLTTLPKLQTTSNGRTRQ